MSYTVNNTLTRNPVQPSDKHVYFEAIGMGFYLTLEEWRAMGGPNHIVVTATPGGFEASRVPDSDEGT